MRRFLALFTALCIALSGSVAMAVESSEPNRLGGYVSIFDWIQGNKDTEYPGSGGGQAAGGGAQRFTTKADYDAYLASLHKTTISKSESLRAWAYGPSASSAGDDPSYAPSVNVLSDVPQVDYAKVTNDYEIHRIITPDQMVFLKHYSLSAGNGVFRTCFYFMVPETGRYILNFSPGLTFYNYGVSNFIALKYPDGSRVYTDIVLTADEYGMQATPSFSFTAGKVYSFAVDFLYEKKANWNQYFYWVDIIPDTSYWSDTFASAEDYGSRPSGYDGTLAVPGDTTSYIDNSNVINGDVTTLYDYSTNTTYNITNWTYDYGDRTYNLTLEDDSTAVVVYGDDGITVQKGAITTEYKYWLADDSGNSSTPGGDGSSSSPGGDSGGSWSGIADLLGKLLKGLSDFLGAILGAIFSALTSLLSVITGSLKGIVDGILAIFEQFPPLFLGFAQFLAAVFPYLPSEILSLLFFGIAAVVFVGLLRFFLNR